MIRTILAAIALTASGVPALAAAPPCTLCKPVAIGDLPFPERKERPKESYGLMDSVRLFFLMDGEKEKPLDRKPVDAKPVDLKPADGCGKRTAYAPRSKCADLCSAAPCVDAKAGDA